MFQELNTMLDNVTSLTIFLVANTDGTITVTVTPKGAKGGVLDTRLSLIGTAAEFDEKFVGILASYKAKRKSLVEQAAATEAILEAAKKESADKAKKSLAKPAESSTPVVSDDEDEPNDEDAESASNTAPTSTVSTSTPTVAASDASDLWA